MRLLKPVYYLYSMIALGEIADKQGDKKLAKKYFTDVKKKTGRKDEAYKDAKRRLQNLEKGRLMYLCVSSRFTWIFATS
ncbi:MAG: hypothetical protein WDO15_30845 [Bacteroidota bacterium]